MPAIVRLLLILLLVCGCSDGRQTGMYAETGGHYRALQTHTGGLLAVRGCELSRDNHVISDDRILMNVLIVCPGVISSGSGSSGSIKADVSEYKYTFYSMPEDVVIEWSWDRAHDVVAIGDTNYRRSEGTVFVIVRQLDGNVDCWQVANASSQEGSEVLRHIREMLPDVDALQDVSLRGSD